MLRHDRVLADAALHLILTRGNMKVAEPISLETLLSKRLSASAWADAEVKFFLWVYETKDPETLKEVYPMYKANYLVSQMRREYDLEVGGGDGIFSGNGA